MAHPIPLTLDPDFTISLHESDLNNILNKIFPLYEKKYDRWKKGSFSIKYSISYSVKYVGIDFPSSSQNEIIIRFKIRAGGKIRNVGSFHPEAAARFGFGFFYNEAENKIYIRFTKIYDLNFHPSPNFVDKSIKQGFNQVLPLFNFPVAVPPFDLNIPRTNRKLGIKIQQVNIVNDSVKIGINVWLLP